jgi:hypothetical protein
MMHFAIRNLQQDITYWAPGAQNVYGQTAPAAPVLLKGRWMDKIQQVRRPNGEEVTSGAEVLLNADVAVSGFLMLGDQTAHATPPGGLDGAMEIQNFSKEPDLRNLESQRKAYL